MDWEPRPVSEIETWVLDAIFDATRGWQIPAAQAPVKRLVSEDGNPSYVVTVDGIDIRSYEQHRWREGERRTVSAGRLVARIAFTGIVVNKPQALLLATFDTCGMPSCGLNRSGQPTLHTAFPIAPNFPVDLARRQLMVCMGTLSETAQDLLAAWRENSGQAQPATMNSDRARNVASVAGEFLRAFIGW